MKKKTTQNKKWASIGVEWRRTDKQNEIRFNLLPKKGIHTNLLTVCSFFLVLANCCESVIYMQLCPFFPCLCQKFVYGCYLSLSTIWLSVIPFARIFRSVCSYGYDVNVALIAFMRCSSSQFHYNFTHIFCFIRKMDGIRSAVEWSSTKQTLEPKWFRAVLFLRHSACTYSWLRFFPSTFLRQSDRFSFHVSNHANFYLNNGGKKYYYAEMWKKWWPFSVALTSGRHAQSECLKLKTAQKTHNKRPIMSRRWIKIDNFRSTYIQKKNRSIGIFMRGFRYTNVNIEGFLRIHAFPSFAAEMVMLFFNHIIKFGGVLFSELFEDLDIFGLISGKRKHHRPASLQRFCSIPVYFDFQ